MLVVKFGFMENKEEKHFYLKEKYCATDVFLGFIIFPVQHLLDKKNIYYPDATLVNGNESMFTLTAVDSWTCQQLL